MKRLFLTISFLLVFTIVFAQHPVTNTESQNMVDLTPTFDGTLKTKYEYALNTKMSRFSVRNSRLGLRGKLSKPVSYRLQVELSNSGQFDVLDLSATVNILDGFDITFGQTGVPVYNSYIVSPGDIMFANRAFLGKYYTSTRDIGVLASYSFITNEVPVKTEFGVFNGFTINDPVWTNKLSYAARVELGSMNGFRTTAKVYNYPLTNEEDYFIWGADFRYGKEKYRLEAEIMNRHNRFNGVDRLSFYIQAGYCFLLNDNSILFKNIAPAIRWDAIGEDIKENDFDAARLTIGLNFGLTDEPFGSALRVDYEHYFVEKPIPEFNRYEEMDSNKITIELLLRF